MLELSGGFLPEAFVLCPSVFKTASVHRLNSGLLQLGDALHL